MLLVAKSRRLPRTLRQLTHAESLLPLRCRYCRSYWRHFLPLVATLFLLFVYDVAAARVDTPPFRHASLRRRYAIAAALLLIRYTPIATLLCHAFFRFCLSPRQPYASAALLPPDGLLPACYATPCYRRRADEGLPRLPFAIFFCRAFDARCAAMMRVRAQRMRQQRRAMRVDAAADDVFADASLRRMLFFWRALLKATTAYCHQHDKKRTLHT